MKNAHSAAYSSMPGVLFLAVFIANAAVWKSPGVGALLLGFFLLAFGAQAGRAAAPDEHPWLRWWLGVWQLLSVLMVAGTAIYYVHSFPAEAAWTLILLTPPLAWLCLRRARASALTHDLWSEAPHRVPPWVLAVVAAALVALALAFRTLVQSATVEAVASPWSVVPPAAFALMGAAGACLAAVWARGRERAFSAVLAAVAVFVFVSVSFSVFPLGSGFDPFIHQATERHIAETGSITPKPLYYAGQYVLVALLHHGFALPVEAADTFLLPLLAALLLPFAWLSAAAHLAKKHDRATLAFLGLFLLPLAAFATTTPQGLANLWLLLLVLAAVPGLARDERPGILALALPALAAVAIHPLAGLPGVLFIALAAADPRRMPAFLGRLAWLPRAKVLVLGSLILPLAFALLAWQSGGQAFHAADWTGRLGALLPQLPTTGYPFRNALDFAVWTGWLAGAAWLALATYGWRVCTAALRWACAGFTGMLAVNYLLLALFVDFSFLIDYERLNYAARLVPLMLFALAPLALAGLTRLAERLAEAPKQVRWFALALAAAAIPALWYAAYPRDDAYLKGHGYNVSAADAEAVQRIEADADGHPYIALANQSVSAAAMRAIGFRYYGPQFFYPIPTGGELYAFFLKMNENPARATAEEAAAWVERTCRAHGQCGRGGIDHVYYVLDAYWWNAPALTATAKTTADAWFAVDGGNVHVFRYDIAGE